MYKIETQNCERNCEEEDEFTILSVNDEKAWYGIYIDDILYKRVNIKKEEIGDILLNVAKNIPKSNDYVYRYRFLGEKLLIERELVNVLIRYDEIVHSLEAILM